MSPCGLSLCLCLRGGARGLGCGRGPAGAEWQAQLEGLGVPCGPDMPSPQPGAVSGASDSFPGDSVCGVLGQLLVVATGGLSQPRGLICLGVGAVFPALRVRPLTEFLKVLAQQARWGQAPRWGEKVIGLRKGCLPLILLQFKVARQKGPMSPGD